MNDTSESVHILFEKRYNAKFELVCQWHNVKGEIHINLYGPIKLRM